jgi:hypothetical protein
MTIGIIGSGEAFTRTLARAGIEAIVDIGAHAI